MNADSPDQSPHRPVPLARLLLYLAIVLITLLTVWLQRESGRRTNSAADLDRPSYSFTIFARHTIGVMEAMRLRPEYRQAFDQAAWRMMLIRAARTPADTVGLVIMIREMAGNENGVMAARELAGKGYLEPNTSRRLLMLAELWSDETVSADTVLAEIGQWPEFYKGLALGDRDPAAHRAARASGLRLLAGSAAVFSAALALGGVGLVVALILLVQALRGRLRRHYQPRSRPAGPADTAFLEAVAITLAVITAIMDVSSYLNLHFSISWLAFLYPLLLLPLFWPRLRGISMAEWRDAVGWRRGRGFLIEAAWGLVGYLAFLPLVFGAAFLSYWLFPSAMAGAEHPFFHALQNASWFRILLLFTLAALIGPLFEETLFRGLFHHDLRYRHGFFATTDVTALIFALLHPQGMVAVPALAGFGLAFSAIREWRGSLVAGCVAHGVNNFLMMTAILLLR